MARRMRRAWSVVIKRKTSGGRRRGRVLTKAVVTASQKVGYAVESRLAERVGRLCRP